MCRVSACIVFALGTRRRPLFVAAAFVRFYSVRGDLESSRPVQNDRLRPARQPSAIRQNTSIVAASARISIRCNSASLQSRIDAFRQPMCSGVAWNARLATLDAKMCGWRSICCGYAARRKYVASDAMRSTAAAHDAKRIGCATRTRKCSRAARALGWHTPDVVVANNGPRGPTTAHETPSTRRPPTRRLRRDDRPRDANRRRHKQKWPP